MRIEIRNAFVALVLLTLLTGVAYPLAVTAVVRVAFADRASGSLLPGGRGSSLVGQPFDDPRYLWGRLSATATVPYNAAASSGSNYAQTNPALVDSATARIAALRSGDPDQVGPVPVELVTASGSGLDPEVSLAAAEYQAGRIARARGIAESTVKDLIRSRAKYPMFGFLGEPRVNVLEINIALDAG